MKWLLLAVLLAVPQTAPPTPREATNSPTSGTNSVADKAQSDKAPTAPTLPVLNPIPANQNQNATGTPQTKNAEQSVTISELPSVSVSRDWADWVLWVFDGLLVLAGFVGIRVAYKTLKTIERQTTATEKAAEATAQSVELSTDTAQRELRAYVCISSGHLSFFNFNGDLMQAKLEIRNCGKTPAYKCRHWLDIWVGEHPLKSDLPESDLCESAALLPPGGDAQILRSKNVGTRVLSYPKSTAYIYGEIQYMDAFGISRYTKYRFIYRGTTGPLSPDSEGNEAN